LECFQEFTADDLGQGFNRNQEIVFGINPALTGETETAGGDDNMEMYMVTQVLIPGMKYCGKSWLSLETMPA